MAMRRIAAIDMRTALGFVPVDYVAGDGIVINDGTISADGVGAAIAPPTGMAVSNGVTVLPDGSARVHVTVVWTASEGPDLDRYEVQISVDGGSTWPSGVTLGAWAMSWLIAGAALSTTYTVQVRAVSARGTKSDWVSGATTTPGPEGMIAAPTGVGANYATASGSDGGTVINVALAWVASTGPSLGTYEVQISVDNGATWPSNVIVGAAATTWIIDGALPSTTYTMRVRAISLSGTSKSAWATASVTTPTVSALYSIAPPTGVGANYATASGSGGETVINVALAWVASAGPGVGSYDIQISADGGSTWPSAVKVGPTATSWIINGAAPSATYTMRVRAVSANGLAVSSWATASATTPSTSSLYSIAPPTGPHANYATASGSDGGVVINVAFVWDPSTGPSVGTYEVQISVDGGSTWPSSVIVGPTATSWIINGAGSFDHLHDAGPCRQHQRTGDLFLGHCVHDHTSDLHPLQHRAPDRRGSQLRDRFRRGWKHGCQRGARMGAQRRPQPWRL